MSTSAITLDEAANHLGVERDLIVSAASQGVFGKVDNGTFDRVQFVNESWTPETLTQRTRKARSQYRMVTMGAAIFLMLSVGGAATVLLHLLEVHPA